MEESPDKRSYKELIACIVVVSIILVSFQVVNLLNNQTLLHANEEISHSLTVWIAPGEEEFHLHLDFYGSENDAYSKTNSFSRLSIRVEPLDAEENQVYLHTIPENLLFVWVKIYINQETEEPNVILNLELGVKANTDLQGHEIGVLLEPWIG